MNERFSSFMKIFRLLPLRSLIWERQARTWLSNRSGLWVLSSMDPRNEAVFSVEWCRQVVFTSGINSYCLDGCLFHRPLNWTCSPPASSTHMIAYFNDQQIPLQISSTVNVTWTKNKEFMVVITSLDLFIIKKINESPQDGCRYSISSFLKTPKLW